MEPEALPELVTHAEIGEVIDKHLADKSIESAKVWGLRLVVANVLTLPWFILALQYAAAVQHVDLHLDDRIAGFCLLAIGSVIAWAYKKA
ncbi:MAG TPA: hypothetical protein V6C86_24085 [Oculatellaceae cyanobacterium]